MKVPSNDIKEETAQVGKKEALHLLVASFLGDYTLTDVFIRHAPISDKVYKDSFVILLSPFSYISDMDINASSSLLWNHGFNI
ncbi:hypothetical protein ACFX2I_029279 [Malus domestica]